MRLINIIYAIFVAIVAAQTQQNYINVPEGGFGTITAGQSFTITWSNPSSGNVDIRLTQGNVVSPGSGIQLTTVAASAGSATFTIPAGSTLNGAAYNFQIVDSSNSNNVNFSPAFVISGATGSAVSSSASSASTSSASVSSSASASSSSASASSSASRSSASSSSSSASRTSSSSAPAASTSAPSSNGAYHVQAGGLLAIMAGAIAVM